MPLRRPLAVPYMAFAVGLPIAVTTVLVLIASVGYGSPLLLQEDLLATVARSLMVALDAPAPRHDVENARPVPAHHVRTRTARSMTPGDHDAEVPAPHV